MRGLKETRVKFHFLGEPDIKNLAGKRKYQGLFDIGVFSVHSADRISPELTTMFKDNATVHVETGDYLIVMKDDQRL